jgi:hypothetical protein
MCVKWSIRRGRSNPLTGRWKRWNPKLIALDVGGIFSPQRLRLGLDARELTPGLVKKIVFSGSECRSEKCAQSNLLNVGDCKVSLKTIERVLHDIGGELKDLRDAPPSRLPKSLVPPPPAGPPPLAVVMLDGGRMMTRQPGHGSGVHEHAWRETKNASLESMTHHSHTADPRPELPDCFQDPTHVAELGGSAPLAAAPPAKANEHSLLRQDDANKDSSPQRLVRTCLSSLGNSKEFGLQMSREAKRRCLDQATHKAFIGDGLSANWTIWKKHFQDFVPILDFIHAVEYVSAAALVMFAHDAQSAWACYLRWAQQCWSGQVAAVIPELRTWLENHSLQPSQTLEEKHPLKPVHDAHRYLSNNASRMNYAAYRTQGLPVTSAPMESLVKQMNLRVKGTEMFWNDGLKGGEAILQIRSAALSDDGRLDTYLTNRPGSPFVRRTAAKTYKPLNC